MVREPGISDPDNALDHTDAERLAFEQVEDGEPERVGERVVDPALLDETTMLCREYLPRQIYFRELFELIFVQPYCKISFVVDAGIARRQTAAEYLQKLEEIGVLESRKAGREKIFLHPALLKLLAEP